MTPSRHYPRPSRSKRYRSIEDVFSPQLTGRLIQASRTDAGVRLAIQDNIGNVGLDSLMSDFAGWSIKTSPTAEVFEVTRRGINLLVAEDPGTEQRSPMFVVRWIDLGDGANWTLLADDRVFYRHVLFITGYRFRSEVGDDFAILAVDHHPKKAVIELPIGAF